MLPDPSPAELLDRPALTVAEAGVVLGVSTATVRRLITAGTLPAVRLSSRTLRVPSAVLRGMLAPGGGS